MHFVNIKEVDCIFKITLTKNKSGRMPILKGGDGKYFTQSNHHLEDWRYPQSSPPHSSRTQKSSKKIWKSTFICSNTPLSERHCHLCNQLLLWVWQGAQAFPSQVLNTYAQCRLPPKLMWVLVRSSCTLRLNLAKWDWNKRDTNLRAVLEVSLF